MTAWTPFGRIDVITEYNKNPNTATMRILRADPRVRIAASLIESARKHLTRSMNVDESGTLEIVDDYGAHYRYRLTRFDPDGDVWEAERCTHNMDGRTVYEMHEWMGGDATADDRCARCFTPWDEADEECR